MCVEHFPGTDAHLVEINLFVHLMTNIHAHLRGVTSWQKMDKSRWLSVFLVVQVKSTLPETNSKFAAENWPVQPKK